MKTQKDLSFEQASPLVQGALSFGAFIAASFGMNIACTDIGSLKGWITLYTLLFVVMSIFAGSVMVVLRRSRLRVFGVTWRYLTEDRFLNFYRPIFLFAIGAYIYLGGVIPAVAIVYWVSSTFGHVFAAIYGILGFIVTLSLFMTICLAILLCCRAFLTNLESKCPRQTLALVVTNRKSH